MTVAALATVLLSTGCSSDHSSVGNLKTLPNPSMPPGSSITSGHGNGSLPSVAAGTLTVGVSCAGVGTLTLTNGGKTVGSVACYGGKGSTSYQLSIHVAAGPLAVSAPNDVAWKIAAGS